MNIFSGLGQTLQNDPLKPQGFNQTVCGLLLCTLAINILSLALPVMTLQVYDRILPNPGTGTLPVLITGVCLAICLEVMLRLTRAYIIGRSGAAYEHRISCNAMEKVLGADLAQMNNYGIGEHLHRIGSVSKLRDFYNGHSLTVLSELLFVPVFLMIIFYIGHSIVLVPAAILIAFIAISLWEGHELRQVLGEREKADDARFNFLIESLEGIHTLKSFALEPYFERRYERLEEQSTQANYKVTQQTSGTFNVAAIFSHLMVAAVISTGAWFVLNGMLTTGGLIAVLLLSGRIMQPVQRALVLWTRYQDYILARTHLEDIMATPQKQIIPHENAHPVLCEGRLNIDKMLYRHKGSDLPIFKDLSLALEPGDSALITGEHGCGKTILLNLIAGIHPATQGRIEIDSRDINTYEPANLVQHVGLIRTDPIIFRGTIRNNITCFGQTNEASAKEVAALLQVDKDVAKLPGGFDTFLNGNSTDSIPPGLKQRIAMVRVLATKPRLILFDNADRSLDKDGYKMVYSLMARLKGKATLVIVSDDQNIRSLADTQYILQDGALQKTGFKHTNNNIKPYKELRL